MFAGLGKFLYSMARLPPVFRVIVREKSAPDKCHETRVSHLRVLSGKRWKWLLCISSHLVITPGWSANRKLSSDTTYPVVLCEVGTKLRWDQDTTELLPSRPETSGRA